MYFFHSLYLGIAGCAVERKERGLWGGGVSDFRRKGTECTQELKVFQRDRWLRVNGQLKGGMILPRVLMRYLLPFRALHHPSIPSCKYPFSLLYRIEPGHFCPQKGSEARFTQEEEAMYHPFSHLWVSFAKKILCTLDLHFSLSHTSSKRGLPNSNLASSCCNSPLWDRLGS